MTDGPGDDVKDRFASRFESDEGDNESRPERKDRTSRSSRNARDSQTVKNVKTEWNTFTFYLDDALSNQLNRLYKKLDWQLADEYDMSISKTRHYYPLVIRLGLEELDSLDSKEIKERLEDLER